MGELHCCSNENRVRSLVDSNNESIGKIHFTKKYIIGSGGFSKVSNILIINHILIILNFFNFRYGK